MNTRASVPVPAPVQTLLRQFHAQRPLRAGSLLVTMFGDAIAPRGGAVTLGSLIRLTAPFGLTERLVRTSVARLASEGWLAARRSGRRSEYRLTAGGARRFADATRRIYGAAPDDWDGRWTLVLLPADAPQARLREELGWLGFGRLTPTLLAHPGCTLAEARAWLRTLDGAGDVVVLRSRSADPRGDRRLAAAGWDLKELAHHYRRFLARFRPVATVLRSERIGAEAAFLVRTLLIHQYRRIHLRDPLLPPALLPPNWVGTDAYELCAGLYGRVFQDAEAFLSRVAHRLHGPLPAARKPVAARFRASGVGRPH